MEEERKEPLFKRVVTKTIVRTKQDVFFAVKCLETNTIISNWMFKHDMRKHIVEYHRPIWFYLTDKLESL